MFSPAKYILPALTLLVMNSTAPAAAQSNQGYIHATVTFEKGESHTGYLRWEREEATWDDLFHTGYRENPWIDSLDLTALNKEKRDQFYATHGLIKRLAYALNNDEESGPGWRMLLIRFGDIQNIEINSGEDDYLITADGGRHRIGGYANDDGSDLWLYEKGEEPLEIEWNDLESIVFSAAPEDHTPYAQRLYGTVETTVGNFTGPIMWDKSECLDIDTLDGENDDGDLTIAMGDIRSIRKVDGNSVLIEEKNGLQYDMWGSNDVNKSNRGIWIHTSDRGWVDVSWKRFIQVTFSDETVSGTPRADFNNNQPMHGTVHLKDGSTRRGRLVYDIDEGFAWDLFNGEDKGITYDIPFNLITEVKQLDSETCRVTLTSGLSLELSQDQDSGTDHGGVLVFADSTDLKTAEYIPWRLVNSLKISFN